MNAPKTVPQIFDRTMLVRRLARAARIGPASFLMDRVVDDLLDRLAATKRQFVQTLDVASPLPAAAEALTQSAPERALTRLSLLPEQEEQRWTSVTGDPEAMQFPAERFDLAVSLLGLQWVNDLPGVLVQIRRLLAPDGLFQGCMIGGQSLHELRSAFTQAEAEITGGATPRVAPFADLRDLGGLLQRAGLALPVTDIDTVTVRYSNLFALMADLRAMGASNILAQRSRRFLRRDVLMRAAEIYASDYADADGRVRATFEILWASGWAPHESQQKPLRPGSARMRLADALPVKTYESDAED